ncbi:MAG: ATPase, T2SS/T4P/T4SS family, partial [Cyanobacteria bacterium J06641_5]
MTNTPTSRSKRSRALTTRRDFSPFGNKLIQAGFADSYQLQQARNKVKETGQPLTEALSAVVGRELPPKLQRQFKQHQLFELKIFYGVESCDPEVNEIDGSQIGQFVDTLLPLDLCRRYKFLPISQEESEPPCLVVAMVEPDNLDAQDDLNRILRPKGLKTQRLVITLDDYQRLFNQYMEERAAKKQEQESARDYDVSSDLANLEGSLEDVPDEDPSADLATSINDAGGAPIINLVNRILLKGIQEKVSDIHIEPQETHLRVRFRKDGVLQQAFEPLPTKIMGAVAARFKIMADLDIAERRLPQDGRIRRKFKGNNVDFRVNSLPSRYGEKICLRILDNSSTQLGLDFLITDLDILELVRSMAARPFGLILVTGRTG